MLGSFGLTVIETRVAEVTVSKLDPEMLPDDALIVVEPAATEVDRPSEAAALLIAATATTDEFQSTAVVKFCVVLSE